MKSRTSLLNRGIFLSTLRRYSLAFFAYFGALSFAILPTMLNELRSVWSYGPYDALIDLGASSALQDAPEIALVVIAVTCGILAALLFSFLYNTRQTGLMASLPVKRESMYLSVALAGFAGLMLGNILVILLAGLLQLVYGALSMKALGILLLVLTLECAAFWGFAVFCCMLTGNAFAGPAVYAIFNVVAYVVEVLIHSLLQEIVFGMPYQLESHTEFLVPAVWIGSNLDYLPTFTEGFPHGLYTWEFQGLGTLAIYAAAGVVLLILGLLLYKRRPMETAGDIISFQPLKPLFKICMAVGTGLVFANFMLALIFDIGLRGYSMSLYLAVLVIVGGLVGWFAAQMLIEKTVRVFSHGWKGALIFAALVLLVFTGVEKDWLGYERKVPEVSEVQEVYVECDYNTYATLKDPENIAEVVKLHKNILSNRSLHELPSWPQPTVEAAAPIAADVSFTENYYQSVLTQQYLELHYQLKDGSTINRIYILTVPREAILDPNSEIRVLEELINSPEAITSRYAPSFPVTTENSHISASWYNVETDVYTDATEISPADWVELFNDCILPDIADGTLGRIDLIEDREYAENKYNASITVYLYGSSDEMLNSPNLYRPNNELRIYPTVAAERTTQFFLDHGIQFPTVLESAQARGFDYNEYGRLEPMDMELEAKAAENTSAVQG